MTGTTSASPHVVRIHAHADVELSTNGAEPIRVQPRTATGSQKSQIELQSVAVTDFNTSGADAEGRLPPVQLAYKDIKFSVHVQQGKKPEQRQILKGCDGVFQPGRLTAVMGSSGAGKTSLVNLVSGNPTAGQASGSLLLNGIEVWDNMSRIRELSAYIQQDDVLFGTQTVREAVTLAARLRLPKSMTDAEKLQRAEDTIAMLGLSKCADTLIGDAFNKGVSGGEKRRVSMALELVKSPSMLFLDEPTSGLDTYTAHNIVSLLRDLAHTQGKTVVCTIHQPSSDIFRMFDDLVLIAHGEIMYHGPAENLVPYFSRRGLVCPPHFNPADYIFHAVLYDMQAQLKLVSDEMEGEDVAGSPKAEPSSPDAASGMLRSEREARRRAAYDAMQEDEKKRIASLLADWKSSEEHAALQHELANPLRSALPDPSLLRAERPGNLYAFRYLAGRRWRDLLRHPMKLRVQGFQYVFFSTLLGLIFLQLGSDQNGVQNRSGMLFFVCVQALFLSFFSNLNTFGPEKLIMMREMQSGLYELAPFFFSRWSVEMPFRCLFPFIYSCILYWMTGLQADGGKFVLFFLTLMLVDNCGTNLAVCICSYFPTIEQVMQFGPAFIMPLMIFSGFYVQIDSIGWWFRWISYWSPIRFGFSSAIQNEMKGLEFSCHDAEGSACVRTGEQQLELLGFDDDPSVGLNIGILVILLGGFLMLAFTFMWRTTRK